MLVKEQNRLLKGLIGHLDAKTNVDAGGIMKTPADTYTCQKRLDLEWDTFFKNHPQIEIEFRTKSIQKEPFLSVKPMPNVILAYSLMPELMSNSLDNKAPSISKRIRVISELASKGWKIGLRLSLIHI